MGDPSFPSGFSTVHELRLLTASCRWIAGRISEILGNEDDVVIELCFNLLEGSRFVCLMNTRKPTAVAGY